MTALRIRAPWLTLFLTVCEIVTFLPTAPTLQELSNELKSVENWHLLGIKLGLHGYQLREIEQNYSRDGQRCKTEVLDLWLRNAKNSTWEAIAEVLSLMKECVVADEIRKKYCCSSTTIGKYTFCISQWALS